MTIILRQRVVTQDLQRSKERQRELCQKLERDNAIYLLINHRFQKQNEKTKDTHEFLVKCEPFYSRITEFSVISNGFN